MPRHARCRSFDFYPQDFLQDQRVQVMTSAQRGAYICLLLAAWESEVPGVLPASRDALGRLAMCSPEEWNHCEQAVGACFDRSDGRWIHRRVRRDHEAQTKRCRGVSERKRRAANARWDKALHAGAYAGAMPPTPKEDSKEESKARKANQTPTETAVVVGTALLIREEVRDTREKSRELWVQAQAIVAAGSVSAACLARCKIRFPHLDLEIIEGKLMAHHDRNPYKRLDVAMLNWCKQAEEKGWDKKTTAPAESAWEKVQRESDDYQRRVAAGEVAVRGDDPRAHVVLSEPCPAGSNGASAGGLRFR